MTKGKHEQQDAEQVNTEATVDQPPGEANLTQQTVLDGSHIELDGEVVPTSTIDGALRGGDSDADAE